MESWMDGLMSADFEKSRVEFYSGYRGDETPRTVVLGRERFEIVDILSRARTIDPACGKVRDIWRCRLENGRIVTVERLEGDIVRVSTAA
jgi:hypothetical protein